MSSTLLRHLEVLYGPAAHATYQRLGQTLRVFQGERQDPGPDRTRSWSQADAVVITYADQISSPGKPPLRVLHEFLRRHLAQSLSGVHLLPFYPSSSDDGFSVMDYQAVDPAFGTWEDVRAFADDFDLMFDAVFNHASAQGAWFRRSLAGDPEFANFFVEVEGDPDLRQVVRPRTLPLLTEFPTATGKRRFWTTFSADQIDLNFRNPEVLLKVIETLLLYVRHGARLIRLDAVTFLWKEPGTSCVHLPQTHRIIQVLRAVLDEVAPDVILITETNVPHEDNISYFGDGTNEAQWVYNFALPGLILHSVATENAESLARWARSLRLPSEQVTFFNFLASHDGIGLNGVRGILTEAEIEHLAQRTRDLGGFVSMKQLPQGGQAPYELNINLLDALAPASEVADFREASTRFLTAHAAMLCLRGVPGLYFHSLFGQRGDPPGAATSGIPRRINRQKFNVDALAADLATPNSLASTIHAGLHRLLQFRRHHAAFHPAAPELVLETNGPVFAVLRRAPNAGPGVLCLHNFSSRTAALPSVLATPDYAGFLRGTDVLTGLAPRRDPAPTFMDPWQTLWLQP